MQQKMNTNYTTDEIKETIQSDVSTNVLMRHLNSFIENDLDTLMLDYTDKSIFITQNATYTGIKNLSITAGVRNLLDTRPSFSNHNVDNVAGAGWDARVGDPRLRSFILRMNYKFK